VTIRHIGLDQPAAYVIRVQGRLNSELTGWFTGEPRMAVETRQQGDSVTVLTGILADQASLHGLLNYIHNLGLVLLYVDCLSAHQANETNR